MDKTVTIKYKTRREYCSCCHQKLPEPVISGTQEFVFAKENAFEWYDDWNNITEHEELQSMVEDFVRETIDFFATRDSEELIIEDSEFDKVREFILNEIIN